MIGFGKFGKKRDLGIVPTEDARLLLIDPSSDGFFANVLNYVAKDEAVRKFIEAVREVQEANIDKFCRPIYDPSIEEGEVVFKACNIPAYNYSFNFWKKKVEEMPTVDGKHWSIGSEYQYYAFLVWLINSLLESGWNVADAIKAVVLDSKKLGRYWNSDDALHPFYEQTGRIGVCGVYDLANTFKMLSCTTKEAGGFWLAGGDSFNNSYSSPLASLYHNNLEYVDYHSSGVGWLVLS